MKQASHSDGFSLDDAGIYFGDNLDAQMAWRGNADLAPLIGRPVRFRFVMRMLISSLSGTAL